MLRKRKVMLLKNKISIWQAILFAILASVISCTIKDIISNAEPIVPDWTNVHTRESFLVATPFDVVIDGEELHLYYDQNNDVFTDEECKIPFLAPNELPYKYYSNIGFVEQGY